MHPAAHVALVTATGAANALPPEVMVAIIGGVTALSTVLIQMHTQRQNRKDHGSVYDEVKALRQDLVETRSDVRADVFDLRGDVRALKQDMADERHQIEKLDVRMHTIESMYTPPATTVVVSPHSSAHPAVPKDAA